LAGFQVTIIGRFWVTAEDQVALMKESGEETQVLRRTDSGGLLNHSNHYGMSRRDILGIKKSRIGKLF
jgi:hypothetical protein